MTIVLNTATKIQYYKQKYDAENDTYKFSTKATGVITLSSLLMSIKNPKRNVEKLIDEIRVTSNKSLKRELKSRLPGFTIQSFNDGKRRAYNNITHFSGLMVLDFDGIEVKMNAIELKTFLFETYPFIISSFISPSGAVKCIISIPKAKNINDYKSYHRAINKHFKQYIGWDDTTKNAVLIMYLTYDKNILIREDAIIFNEKLEKNTVLKNNNCIRFTQTISKNSIVYKARVLSYIETIFNGIINNGHPQVIRLSSKLGSFTSYYNLNSYELQNWMNIKIEKHPYLSKDPNNYKTTEKRFFKEGYLIPLQLPNNPLRVTKNYKKDERSIENYG